MMHSSAYSQNAKTPAVPQNPASESTNPLLRAVQEFWRFSKFYGEFMSTPIRERKIRH